MYPIKTALVVSAALGISSAAHMHSCSADAASASGPAAADTGSKGPSQGATTNGDASAFAGDAAPDTGKARPFGTIFTILLENHDYDEILAPDGGPGNAPFIRSLADTYGLATAYADSGIHPSLPNYLTMVSGGAQYAGGVDLNPQAAPFPVTAENLGSQLEAKAIPWRVYNESIGTPCRLTPIGKFAPKHDPFLYFSNIQNGANGLCARTNVDYTEFAPDLAGGTYKYMWITPNLTDDGHDPTTDPVAGLKASDAWTKTAVEAIMASAAYKNGGVIFLTWDEAEGRNGHSKDRVPMIIISPKLKAPGYRSNKAYSHKSYLATVEDILGLPRLATVANEPSMMEFFE